MQKQVNALKKGQGAGELSKCKESSVFQKAANITYWGHLFQSFGGWKYQEMFVQAQTQKGSICMNGTCALL